jgi:hypothetical protein
MAGRLAHWDAMVDKAIKQLIHLTNTMPPTTDPDLTQLGSQYGLVVITDATNLDTDVKFGPVDNTQKRLCYEMFAAELAVYDPDVIKASGLQRLILCTNLESQGEKASGLAEVGRFVVDSLVFSATDITRQWERARATLHHEIFHAIDYRDDLTHYVDPEWRMLNGAEYHYNDSLQFTAGEYYSDAVYFPRFNFRDVQKVPAGFLNEYGTQSVHEDKAIFYSWLLVRYTDLEEICAQDSIVAAKVEYMKRLLAKFHPSFNEEFWRKIDQRAAVLGGTNYDGWKRGLERLP